MNVLAKKPPNQANADNSVQITMRISKEDLELINAAAKQKRISRSGFFRLAAFKLIDDEKLK
jgi:uncharacterized protein (DUF1778 family)